MKILIVLICSFYVCTAFHEFDYQLCRSFKFQNNTINGVHVKYDFFVMNFQNLENLHPDLTNSAFYKGFKDLFKKYPESTNLQKRVFRYEIANRVDELVEVISQWHVNYS